MEENATFNGGMIFLSHGLPTTSLTNPQYDSVAGVPAYTELADNDAAVTVHALTTLLTHCAQ